MHYTCDQNKKSESPIERLPIRSLEILRLIDLDFSSTFSLLDLPPVKEYEMYIRNFGKTNTKQAYVQCNEDAVDREIQTEEIDFEEKWTQHPGEGAVVCGGHRNDAVQNVGIVTKVDTQRLTMFLRSACQVVTVLLEEDRAEKQSNYKVQSKDPCLSISESCFHLNTNLAFLQGRSVYLLQFSEAQRHLLLTVHGLDTSTTSTSLGGTSILSVYGIYGSLPRRRKSSFVSLRTKILAHKRAQKSGPGSVPHPLAHQSLSVGGDEDVHHSSVDVSFPSGERARQDILQDRLRGAAYYTEAVILPKAVRSDTLVSGTDWSQPFFSHALGLNYVLFPRGLPLHLVIRTYHYLSSRRSGSDRVTHVVIDGIFIQVSHTHPVKAVEPVPSTETKGRGISSLSSPEDMSGLSFQVASLDESGHLILWVFSQRCSNAGKPQALNIKFLPKDFNHFVIGTDIGLVTHGTRYGLIEPPMQYRSMHSKLRPAQVTAIDFSPFGAAAFLSLSVGGDEDVHQQLLWTSDTFSRAAGPLRESSLPINVLEIRAIFLSLRHWERILRGLPVRIQTDNATAVAYVNHQGGTRSSLALAEVSKILLWAEATVPVISAVHIPGVENWAADFLSRKGLAAGEWSLHPEVFHQICLQWGTPDVDLTASRVNRKVPQFVSRSRDPLAVGVDALAIPWSQFELPYLFPPLPLLPKLLKKIKAEGVPVILIAPDWPRRAWFAELVNLLADAPLAPSRQARSAVPGSDLPPEFSVAQFNGVAVETAVLRASGLSDRVIHTMIQARKPSSSRIYYRTWKAYFRWCESNRDKVVFRPPPSFLPKVVSTFHLNEDIVLTFCPAPTHPLERSLNKLDLVRAVRIYLDRTSTFRKTDSFFVIPDGTRRGQPASKATIARWIRMAILEAYRVKNRVPPPGIKAHSTRAVGASWAVHHRASALQLCKAATWSSIHNVVRQILQGPYLRIGGRQPRQKDPAGGSVTYRLASHLLLSIEYRENIETSQIRSKSVRDR
ncbi:unnamed protein product [Ranitomeya imitator]|uniref:Uncharacterized protein n=1 Tax=Ranitomeya imitator TaxID=111125 RepID=A0ABN9LTU5_9NEOB|nr:unnamed protein product [Ranitomeya imitator]